MGYEEEYSEASFWAKLAKFALAAGRSLVEQALTLYYTLLDPETPKWAKGVIVSALGYFIFPLDAIPDLTPLVGYADDVGAIAAAFGFVAAHISPETRERARRQTEVWFGPESRIAVLGLRGSGKTTIKRYLTDFIDKNENDKRYFKIGRDIAGSPDYYDDWKKEFECSTHVLYLMNVHKAISDIRNRKSVLRDIKKIRAWCEDLKNAKKSVPKISIVGYTL